MVPSTFICPLEVRPVYFVEECLVNASEWTDENVWKLGAPTLSRFNDPGLHELESGRPFFSI